MKKCSQCDAIYSNADAKACRAVYCSKTGKAYTWIDISGGEKADAPADSTNPKDLVGVKKPPVHLVPPAALLYGSRVMGLGAAKYGPYNWRTKKVKYTVYIAAAMRHLMAALDGEELDPESGQPHVAHAWACASILLDAKATGNLIDDRPTPGAAAKLITDLTEK